MEDIKTRFLREGYVANKIGHAGVVRVTDDDVAPDGCVYLVMELLEGKTLEAHRKEAGGRLPSSEALVLGGEILDILAAAHTQRIIHRDIKPDNVFLTNAGQTKLMDFGIARLLDASHATGAGALMGTPQFMPPEQASGRNKDIDARSDVWSVGALLFILITGEEVHRARSSAEQMIYAATNPARSIAKLALDLPAEVAHVIDVALAFDMRNRWQTAAAMRNALRYASGRTSALPDDVPLMAKKDVGSSPRMPVAPALVPPSSPTPPASSRGVNATLIQGSADPQSIRRAPTIIDDPTKTTKR
jgi:serine/threonine-protein kinase